jgi:nucleotide-binding universal stress UspA family protein
MFKKIVVPLDGSARAERALTPAKAVAEQVGVPVELVMSDVHARTGRPHAYLTEAGRRADLADFGVLFGDPPIVEMLASACDEEETLVCMTTHGRAAVEETFLGHTAKDLLAGVDTPFLVVGPRVEVTRHWTPERLLVCTDGSSTADAIIPIAADWMTALRLGTQVLSVVAPESAARARAVNGDVLEANVARYVATELEGEDRGPVDWEVLHGHHPASSIVDFTDRIPNAVIAMATHGRTGLAGVAVGSVTNAVIRFANSPVLVVRPHDLQQQEA